MLPPYFYQFQGTSVVFMSRTLILSIGIIITFIIIAIVVIIIGIIITFIISVIIVKIIILIVYIILAIFIITFSSACYTVTDFCYANLVSTFLLLQQYHKHFFGNLYYYHYFFLFLFRHVVFGYCLILFKEMIKLVEYETEKR